MSQARGLLHALDLCLPRAHCPVKRTPCSLGFPEDAGGRPQAQNGAVAMLSEPVRDYCEPRTIRRAKKEGSGGRTELQEDRAPGPTQWQTVPGSEKGLPGGGAARVRAGAHTQHTARAVASSPGTRAGGNTWGRKRTKTNRSRASGTFHSRALCPRGKAISFPWTCFLSCTMGSRLGSRAGLGFCDKGRTFWDGEGTPLVWGPGRYVHPANLSGRTALQLPVSILPFPRSRALRPGVQAEVRPDPTLARGPQKHKP